MGRPVLVSGVNLGWKVNRQATTLSPPSLKSVQGEGQRKKPQQCAAVSSPFTLQLASVRLDLPVLLIRMLIFVDRVADPILLAVDAFLLGLGEVAVVRRHIFLFAILDARLTLF